MGWRANRRVLLVSVTLGAVALIVTCGFVLGVGWYWLYGPGTLAQRPAAVAIFQTATRPLAPTLPPFPPFITNTPGPLVFATPAATPTSVAPTRPRATAAPGTLTGKIAFSVDRGERPEDKSIWVMNVDGSGARQILERASSPAFSPDGKLIAYYRWTDGIFVANADGTSPRKIVGETDAKYLAWSHSGAWIAFASQPTPGGNVHIDAVKPDGTARRRISVGSMPAWSFDDRQIALSTCKGTVCGIHRVSSDGGDPIPVTSDAGGNPAWAPDGRRILYQVEAGNVKQLFVVNSDGTGKRQLTFGAAIHVDAQWSADGNYIFYRSPESGVWAIYRMNSDGTRPLKLIDDAPPVDWAYEKLAVFTLTK